MNFSFRYATLCCLITKKIHLPLSLSCFQQCLQPENQLMLFKVAMRFIWSPVAITCEEVRC